MSKESKEVKSDIELRVKAFQVDVNALLDKYNLVMKAQIQPDGPVINLFDKTPSDEQKTSPEGK